MATFTGTSGSDTLLGSAGNDIFHASGGTDRVWGGTGGIDRLVLTGSMSSYSFRDNGDGTFAITDLRPDAPDGSITFRDIDELAFTDGVRTIAQAKAQGVNIVTGTSGNDTLIGSGGTDELRGGAGDDRIWGSAGNDAAVYTGRMSDYKIVANGDGSYTVTDLRGGVGDGTDIVRDVELFRFSDGTQSLATFIANSTADGVSVVQGGGGNDHVLGTAGNDILIGKGGDDHIWGGTGGIDTVVMSGRLADYAIKANANGSYTITDLRAGASDGIDVVRDVEMFRFADRSVSLDVFRSTYEASATNTISGTAGNDVLLGTSGNDVILARGGNDRIWGGKSGQDTAVFTGKASDYVVTDNGNGSYTLVDARAGSPDGIDVVRDIDLFRFADKTLSLAQLDTSAQRLVTTISGGSGNDQLSGSNTGGMIGANTNDMIIGGTGNDTLRGGAGNDLLMTDSAGRITATSTTSTDLSSIEIKVSTTGIVTFLGESAGFRNSLGSYKVAADGSIYDVKVLFANASVVGSGGDLVAGRDSVSLDLVAGDKLGFFIVSNGYNQPGMAPLLSDKTGSFKFVGPNGIQGNVGTTADLKLVHVAANGAETVIRSQYGTSIFHSTLGTNMGLNADDITHVTGVTRYADGSIKLGFEDLLGGGDRDYDDSVFSLQVGTANTVLMTSSTTTSTVASVVPAGGGYLLGGLGSDTLVGGAGNDILNGGVGADLLIGGSGMDTADYSHATAGTTVDLASGGLGGEAAGDTYVSIEMVKGSAHADVIRGTSESDVLDGYGGNDLLDGRSGNDVLRGGVGADVLVGGDGFDTATYYDAASGVTVDLGLGIGTRGDAAGDVMTSIERVQGSNNGDDVLIGSAGNDELQGYGGSDWLRGGDGNDVLGGGNGNDTLDSGAGNDILSGGAGADLIHGAAGDDYILGVAPTAGQADSIDGGAGLDVIDYSRAERGVKVDLSGEVVAENPGRYDVLVNVEDVIGSAFADVIWGDAGSNRLNGGAGDDSIRGGAGDDLLDAQDGNDVLFGDAGNDTISGGRGFDVAVYDRVMAEFTVRRLDDGSWLVTGVGAAEVEGVDVVLANTERLVFADATLDLRTSEISTTLTAYDYLFQV